MHIKSAKFCIQIYFCFQCQVLRSDSPLDGGYHLRITRNCKLQLTERFPRNLTSWNVRTFYIRSSLDIAMIQSLPLLSTGQQSGLLFSALLLSSGACRKAGLISCSLRTYSHQQKLTYIPLQAQQSLSFFLHCWCPPTYLSAALAII